jgi:hypothetical protein
MYVYIVKCSCIEFGGLKITWLWYVMPCSLVDEYQGEDSSLTYLVCYGGRV